MLSARNQVTLWTWDGAAFGGSINDYSAKNGWAGLIGDYYGGRWSMYAATLANATASKKQPDWNAFNAQLLVWAQAWIANTSAVYPTSASGASPASLALSALSSYSSVQPLSPTSPPSGYKAYAGMDIPSLAPGYEWVITGNASVAVSDDCPYIAHGDSVNGLAACQVSCEEDAECNTINYSPNAYGGDCIFRECVDPSRPQLTPSGNYTVYGLLNATRVSGIDIMTAWHKDVGVLAALCTADPGCLAFNSHGILKATAQGAVSSPGTDLYVKQ